MIVALTSLVLFAAVICWIRVFLDVGDAGWAGIVALILT